MTTHADADRMKTWRAFQWANTVVMRNLDKEMALEGLAIGWFDVLIHLAEAADGRLRMQDLASSVVMSRSGTTRLIDRMELASLVQREQSAEDRRGFYAVITSDGRRELERIWPMHERGVIKHFTSLLETARIPILYETFKKIIIANEGPESFYA